VHKNWVKINIKSKLKCKINHATTKCYIQYHYREQSCQYFIPESCMEAGRGESNSCGCGFNGNGLTLCEYCRNGIKLREVHAWVDVTV